MNTDDANKRKADAMDALAALAAGETGEAAKAGGSPAEQEPAGSPEAQAPAEHDSVQDEVPQEAFPDDEPRDDGARDFMLEMARESQGVNSELSGMQDMTGDLAAIVSADDWDGSPPGNGLAGTRRPEFSAPLRAARLQANTRRAHGHAFKKIMIPLLLAVGGVLIIMSIFTMVVLLGDRDDPYSWAPDGSRMRTYGKFILLASLPTGVLLLFGARMFWVELSKARGARK
jgi:hypothetical protein